MKKDKLFLRRAIEIAINGIDKGGGPFGAIITLNGRIIAEAHNMVVLSGDPTAHAEILAIRKAAQISGNHDLTGCSIYSSCEPCPMCLGAIYWAGIKKVVYATERTSAAHAGFNDDFIYKELLLDPVKRSIDFICHPDAGGDEVFKKWDEYEDKHPY
jgi:tRNA(Arg) A34 adenosine deaminase TadA